MGLLDMGGAQPSQPQGGLLGAFQGGQPQGAAPAQQGSSPELQMAMQLAQNPTPQMAQQIVAQMRKAGMPEADQIAQFLAQAGEDPQAIKQIADAAVKALSQ